MKSFAVRLLIALPKAFHETILCIGIALLALKEYQLTKLRAAVLGPSAQPLGFIIGFAILATFFLLLQLAFDHIGSRVLEALFVVSTVLAVIPLGKL